MNAPSQGENLSRECSERTKRQLGAEYMHAHVTRDDVAIATLRSQHGPSTLFDAVAITCDSLIRHVAELERTAPAVIACAYRDVWTFIDAAGRPPS